MDASGSIDRNTRRKIPSGTPETILRWLSTILVLAVGIALIVVPPASDALAADGTPDPLRIAVGVGLILLLVLREIFARLASR